jgi:multidrug resistance efflux pump
MTCCGQRLLWSRLICESVRSHRDKLRYENLFRQKSASSQQLDTAAANADALAATVALDKAPRMSRNSIQLGGATYQRSAPPHHSHMAEVRVYRIAP